MNTCTRKNTHCTHCTRVFMHKHQTDTNAQTHLYCTLARHKHLHTGVDGGPCLACSAGKYKSGNGSAACSSCPLNTNSSAASTNPNDCKCKPGYTGEDEHPRQTRHKPALKTTHEQHPNTNTHINLHNTHRLVRLCGVMRWPAGNLFCGVCRLSRRPL
jgi:hypothetical protein